ncbi:hypothetical protein RvY_06828 [Ramazzottius varieornatus]|uniref:Uncharacterized protein n=1 Tax=Ramazzottius varieornatus TaxID=947166 RepID=A0A1D1UZX4_RAMVA|nr:hypothetical protein RvY_06828 [Ramazzottius varieornatus]
MLSSSPLSSPRLPPLAKVEFPETGHSNVFWNGSTTDDRLQEGSQRTSGETEISQTAEEEKDTARSIAEQALLEEIHVAQRAIQLFYNNDIAGAKRTVEDRVHHSMYAAVTYGTILYLQALMTVTAEDARAAIKTLKNAQNLCWSKRQGRFSRAKRNEEQVHAELCYAECGLMLSALVLAEDVGLTALIRAGWKFKSSHSTYQTCLGILREREWSNPKLKAHFESGVRLGIGSFNLIFSCVPSKHAKYLSMVGFKGVAKVGHSELEAGVRSNGCRNISCLLVATAWETYGKIILGTGHCDLAGAENSLKDLLHAYPNGAPFLFLQGRVAMLKGQFREALEHFDKSMKAQMEWIQSQHMCLWESMWCHSCLMDYQKAAEIAYYLYKENSWSKATYAYLTASFLLMMDKQEMHYLDTKVTVRDLMKEALAKKQKLAGRSLLSEKLAEKRYKRYIEQGRELIFPATECFYLFGGMTSFSNRPDLVLRLLVLIEAKVLEVRNSTSRDSPSGLTFHTDSIYQLDLLRGICLGYLGRLDEAFGILDGIVEAEDDIAEDKFLPPHAAIELACLKLRTKDHTAAMEYCTKALSFKDYFMQTKLELRILATMELTEERQRQLEAEEKDAPMVKDSPDEFHTPPSSPKM